VIFLIWNKEIGREGVTLINLERREMLCEILIGKPERDNLMCGLDSYVSGQGPVVGCC
jgi:hypothetical protein